MPLKEIIEETAALDVQVFLHVIAESVVPVSRLLFREEYRVVESEEFPSIDPLVLADDVIEPFGGRVTPVE